MDGEREPVPAHRVDEHLAGCPECTRWHQQMTAQMSLLTVLASGDRSRMASVANTVPQLTPPTRRIIWPQIALALVGVAQLGLTLAQALGATVGLHAGHPAGGHLVNEATAWSAALGVAMVAAALRPTLAPGLAVIGGVFTAVLTGYVVADEISGAVTVTRVLSHLPALAGTVLAIVVWRLRTTDPDPQANSAPIEVDDITLPDNASRGRRRGHLWPTDGAA
jgi:predicted anti-sigma-YlaC factor YlaD